MEGAKCREEEVWCVRMWGRRIRGRGRRILDSVGGGWGSICKRVFVCQGP